MPLTERRKALPQSPALVAKPSQESTEESNINTAKAASK
jgi:hypothetical protein